MKTTCRGYISDYLNYVTAKVMTHLPRKQKHEVFFLILTPRDWILRDSLTRFSNAGFFHHHPKIFSLENGWKISLDFRRLIRPKLDS
jgi:hypothetical protein